MAALDPELESIGLGAFLQAKIDFAYAQLRTEQDAAKREFWGKVITSSIAALAGVGAAAAGKPG